MSLIGLALLGVLVGALMFILGDSGTVTSVGWAIFIVSLIAAAVLAVIAASRSRRGPHL